MNTSRTLPKLVAVSLLTLAVLLSLEHASRSCPPGLPQVYIWATDPNASEVGPDTGKFRIYRSGGDSSLPLVVYFVQPPGGTAQNGTDYQTLPEYVTIPANTSYAEVTVTPILDANCAEGNETVVLTLATNANYWLAWPTNATVTIADVPPNADSDADGLPDCWELQHFGNLNQTGLSNPDNDVLTNLQEYLHGTNPNQPDTAWDTQAQTGFLLYTPLR